MYMLNLPHKNTTCVKLVMITGECFIYFECTWVEQLLTTCVDKSFKCPTRQIRVLETLKSFVNYVSKYYNGTPSVQNRYSHLTQLDMTCPREDIPHLQ